jgi:hypothetical protein
MAKRPGAQFETMDEKMTETLVRPRADGRSMESKGILISLTRHLAPGPRRIGCRLGLAVPTVPSRVDAGGTRLQWVLG